MASTLFDVCKLAGVSTATVSRVINTSSLVTAPTRQRVLRAIKKLDYHPSYTARTLARRSTNNIGVVFPGIASGFFTEVLCGIDEVAAEHRFHLTTVFAHSRGDEQELVMRTLRERRVDGLIAMNLSLPEALLKSAAKTGIPVVLIDRPARNTRLFSVGIDNIGGAHAAMQHLLDHGYRRISILAGPSDSYDAMQRLAGYRRALNNAAVTLPEELFWPGAFTEESGRHAMARWLDAGRPLPQAICAGNDAMALGALAVLRERNYRVPEHVVIVGFDDVETARHLGLTTVHVPMRQIGRAAAEATLQQVLHGKKLPAAKAILPVHLVVRRSCGCDERAEKQQQDRREIQV